MPVTVADQQIDQQDRLSRPRRGGVATTLRPAVAAAEIPILRRARQPFDEVVEGREAVRRGGQRQPGLAAPRRGADGVEAALTQQLGGGADQRIPSPFPFGVTAVITL